MFRYFIIFTLIIGIGISVPYFSSAQNTRPPIVKSAEIEKKNDAFFFTKLAVLMYNGDRTWDDSSIERFVTKTLPLSDRGYTPDNLVSISGANINQAGRNSLLRKEANDGLQKLAADFRSTFSTPLTVVSGYRSAKYQQRLWDLGRCTDTLCAPPGYSEHQLGLAIDIFDATNERDFIANKRYKQYVSWMRKNAAKYGYTQSYQRGPKIDGYDIEPWHWRYVGVDIALKLETMDMTYSEYIEFQSMLRVINSLYR